MPRSQELQATPLRTFAINNDFMKEGLRAEGRKGMREKYEFVETELEERLNIAVSIDHDEPNR
jgi:hypothetical protein